MSPDRPRVLVTRSEPGAGETAGRLEAEGFAAIVEPLFAIVPSEVTIPEFDALAFTSANGVREMARRNQRRNVPVYCVGDRTADVAREAGYERVESAAGDVDALAQLIGLQLPTGLRLLHAGNEDSRGDLAGQLRSRGGSASFIALFRAEAVVAPGPALSLHLAGEPAFEAVLIHSPRAAAILAGFSHASSARAPLNVAAMSAAAAAPLAGLTNGIAIAGQPNEKALISVLAELVSG